jgi:hypothetical protein
MRPDAQPRWRGLDGLRARVAWRRPAMRARRSSSKSRPPSISLVCPEYVLVPCDRRRGSSVYVLVVTPANAVVDHSVRVSDLVAGCRPPTAAGFLLIRRFPKARLEPSMLVRLTLVMGFLRRPLRFRTFAAPRACAVTARLVADGGGLEGDPSLVKGLLHSVAATRENAARPASMRRCGPVPWSSGAQLGPSCRQWIAGQARTSCPS